MIRILFFSLFYLGPLFFTVIGQDINSLHSSIKESVSYNYTIIEYSISMFVIISLGIILFKLKDKDLGFQNHIGWKKALKNPCISFPFIFYSLGLLGLILYLGTTNYIEEIKNNSNYIVEAVSNIIIYFIIAGFIEEIIFRGIIYQEFKKRYDIYFSIFISSILFGFIHISNGESLYAGLVNVLFTTVFGIYLASVFEYTKNIILVTIIHAYSNITFILSLNFYQSYVEVLKLYEILFLSILTITLLISFKNHTNGLKTNIS